MIEYTSEQLQNAFKKASPKIQEILNDVWISQKTAEIGSNFGLRIDRVNKLVNIVGLILLNLISLKNLIKVLSEELNLNQKRAKSLAGILDKEVFDKVREIVIKNKEADHFKKKDIEDSRKLVDKIMVAVEEGNDQNLSFKDKLNQTKVYKEAERKIDPYLEPIDN